jgi:hypothetical protein
VNTATDVDVQYQQHLRHESFFKEFKHTGNVNIPKRVRRSAAATETRTAEFFYLFFG